MKAAPSPLETDRRQQRALRSGSNVADDPSTDYDQQCQYRVVVFESLAAALAKRWEPRTRTAQ